ncbi:hypothetical protein MUP59_03920, partial [Candidatus Bathyarchaeota archaeon]|nr:hypothetical protein [Candidatus Bathyarchaeota archaeon]
MKYRTSKMTSVMVLATLFENKKYPQYDMDKAIDKDYRTVLRHLQMLEYNDLIQQGKTEPS